MVLTFRAPVLAHPSSGNCQDFCPSASTLVMLHLGAQIPNLMDLCTRLPYCASLSNLQPHWPLWAPRRNQAATCQMPSSPLHSSFLRQPSLIARLAQSPLESLTPIILQGSGLILGYLLSEWLPTWLWVPESTEGDVWYHSEENNWHRVGAVWIWIGWKK